MKNKILGFDLDELIKESLTGLFETVQEDESTSSMKEKLKQQSASEKASKRKSKQKTDPKERVSDEASDNQKPVSIKHEKVPEINAKSIIDKIDKLRSGKSLKDPETKKAFKAYYEKLYGPERIALFAFLSGLAKVMGKQDGKAKTPHAEPYAIDMAQDKTADTGKKKKDQPKGTKEISSSGKSENPIIVGERANTQAIKSMLWRK